MRAVLRFLIQLGIIVLAIRLVVKYTTFDDKIVSFFRSNSNLSQTGNVAQLDTTMCTLPWGQKIPDGSSIYAYSSANPADCKEELRTCTAGQLDGSYSVAVCATSGNSTDNTTVQPVQGASCTTPWGETLNDGAYIIAYESVQSCRFEKRYCQNGTLNGSYASNHCNSPVAGEYAGATSTPSSPQVVTVNYGYVQATPVDHSYDGPSRTNANGIVTVINSWNDQKNNPSSASANDSSYIKPVAYQNYDLTQHGCTTPWGTYMDSSTWVIAYKSPTPSVKGGSCTYERRTCFQGILGGSYIYPSCSIADNSHIYDNNGQDYFYPVTSAKRSCTTPWGQTVKDGNYVLAYKNSYTNGYSCEGEYRYCSNGQLQGSYQYRSCNMEQTNYRCSLPWGGTIPHGSSVVAYASTYSCASEIRTCSYGRLLGTYRYASSSCNDNNNYYYNNYSCSLPRGGSIGNGGSVTAYSSPYGPCYSQRRTCNNGYLNGSYQYSSCNDNHDTCGDGHCNDNHQRCQLPRGGTIGNGGSVTAYSNPNGPCYSQTRTCNNGYLNGSYQYSSCVDRSHASCQLPRGGTIADGASVTAYNSSTSPCYSQTRTCNNGYLNGSYQYASCINSENNSCTTPRGQTIANGAHVEAYQTTVAPCYKEVRTCHNGYLDGSFQNNYCNPNTTNGGSDIYGAWQSAGEREGNIDSQDTCNANATSPYLCGSESANSCTDYAKINCTSFSPMICTYQMRNVSCVK